MDGTRVSEVLPSNIQLYLYSFVLTCRFYKVFGRFLLFCLVWTGMDSVSGSSAGLYWIRINGSWIWTGLDLSNSIHSILCRLVMSIGNQKFGIPRKYQYQIGIWYFCPKFLGIFLVFYQYFEKALVKIWLNIAIFGRIKIGLVFGFCSCHFIGIGLVLVCNFSENDTSIADAKRKTAHNR